MTAVETMSAGAVSRAGVDWDALEWDKIQRNVRRLQARIVKATQDWETASCPARHLRGLSRVTGDCHARF